MCGNVVALSLDGKNGALSELCPPVSAGGTSTCYLTIHKAARRMLLVNYWDSTIFTLELLPDGKLGRQLASYDPKQGRGMKASADTPEGLHKLCAIEIRQKSGADAARALL